MKIKAAVVDFGTSRKHNFLIKGIETFCDIEEDTSNPDYILYSCFGAAHLKYKNAVKIFICDENVFPDFNQCDYAVGCVRIECGNRYLWFPPCYSTYMNREIPALPELDKSLSHRKFCSFVYSQCGIGAGSILRRDFCQALMKYKHVDCPGRVLHNMDAPELAKRGDAANWNSSKLKFLSQYKFNIAFENSSIPGYITEKLMDAYLANTVPIYFGSEGDVAPFPKESMICANDFPDFESLINRIKELDEDDDAYMAKLAANPLRNGMELNPLQMLKAFLQPVMEKTPTTFEKDPLMVSDATRLIRIGGKGTLSIRFEMFRIAIKALFAKYIQKDNSKRNKLGVEYWQKKYALDDARQLAQKSTNE